MAERGVQPGSDGEKQLQVRFDTVGRADDFYEHSMLDYLNERMQTFLRERRTIFVGCTSERHTTRVRIRSDADEFSTTVTDQHLECEQTWIGPRFTGEEFETLVYPVDDRQRENLDALAIEITESIEIRLEYEAHYDRFAFVPQRDSDAGTLTKYFGKVAGEDEFKVRGIEDRQRSTSPFIAEVQRDCLRHSWRDTVC